MKKNMSKLLKKIGFSEDKYNYFNDTTLEKIVGNKDKTKYKFYLKSENLLPVDIYNNFNELLCKSFNEYESVKPFFNVSIIDTNLVREHYNNIIKIMANEHPSLEQFLDSEIKFENNTFTVPVIGRGEELKYKSIMKDIELYLKSIGLEQVSFEIIVTEIEEKEEIAIKIVEKEENHLIKGRFIKSDPTPLKQVLFENPDETIMGTIFAVETKEFPTTNMITLKITDYTDSIECKMFEKDSDKYKALSKALKPGVAIKVRGNVRYDNFSKEIVMFANDINKIEIKKESRKDTFDEKRVELHCHTKMSQMDGVVEAQDLVKQASKWGHKAIGITDHNGVQSFPDVYHAVCNINSKLEEGQTPFKALYG